MTNTQARFLKHPGEMTIQELRDEVLNSAGLEMTEQNWCWIRALAFELLARSLLAEVQAESLGEAGEN